MPITFLSLDGSVVGLCLGRERPEESLAMLLDRLLAEPGWAEIYGRWSRAAERRAIVEVMSRLALPVGVDLRPEVVCGLAAARMPGGDTPGARSALRRLNGYLCAHLSELFGRAGVPLVYRGGRGSPLDLRPAFRIALRWYLCLPLERWAGAAAVASDAARRGGYGAPSWRGAIRGPGPADRRPLSPACRLARPPAARGGALKPATAAWLVCYDIADPRRLAAGISAGRALRFGRTGDPD